MIWTFVTNNKSTAYGITDTELRTVRVSFMLLCISVAIVSLVAPRQGSGIAPPR